MQCDFLKMTLEKLSHFRTTGGILRYYKYELNKNQLFYEQEMTKNLKLCIRHYIEIKRYPKGFWSEVQIILFK